MGSRFRLHGGGLSAGDGDGVGSRFRPHGGRLFAGGRGMGPRIREDNGGGMDSRFRLCEGTLSVRGDGDGSPLPSLRGRVLRGGTGMGPRIREDNGGGDGSPPPRLRGGRISTRGQRVEMAVGDGRFPNHPYEGECCRTRGSPPSPVLTRAGSNLPPSRGKGFVGDERAIFIVMICGECAALRSGGGRGRRRCLGGAIVA